MGPRPAPPTSSTAAGAHLSSNNFDNPESPNHPSRVKQQFIQQAQTKQQMLSYSSGPNAHVNYNKSSENIREHLLFQFMDEVNLILMASNQQVFVLSVFVLYTLPITEDRNSTAGGTGSV